MELEETIKDLKDKIWLIKSGNISGKENFEKLGDEIDTVLKELDNRIPKKYIEDKIEKVRCETTHSYNDWKYDEKVYNAEHNMINIIEKELLNKEEI